VALFVAPTLFDPSRQPTIYNEFLKWYEDCQNSSSIASIAHTSTSFVDLTRSNSLNYWVGTQVL